MWLSSGDGNAVDEDDVTSSGAEEEDFEEEVVDENNLEGSAGKMFQYTSNYMINVHHLTGCFYLFKVAILWRIRGHRAYVIKQPLLFVCLCNREP